VSATLGALLVFALASAVAFSRRGRVRYAGLFAGIRDLLSSFTRCPCAGRHLLFFAAAKKSRQKKAAHTANPCSCLRAPNRSRASYGSVSVPLRCQRFESTPHPLRAPVVRVISVEQFRPHRWQTVCRLSRRIGSRSYRVERMRGGRSEACEVLRPTHSLPPGRPRSIWHVMR